MQIRRHNLIMNTIKVYKSETITIKMTESEKHIFNVYATDGDECFYSNYFIFYETAKRVFNKLIERYQ